MMDEEEFEDYLVDKAKEILNEDITESEEVEPETPQKEDVVDEDVKDKSAGNIPFSWDPREVEHLTRNRKKMSNEDLKKFFERDSEFQEKLQEVDNWKGFTRWEERLMVQQHSVKTPEEIAMDLDRDKKEVELKMHMMGLIPKDELR